MSTSGNDFLWLARTGDIDSFEKAVTEDISLLNSKDENDNTALHMASANGHLDILLFILSQPVSSQLVNTPNLQGNTPLHWAVLNRRYEVISALVNFGAICSCENVFNETPVDVAIKLEDAASLEIFEKLPIL